MYETLNLVKQAGLKQTTKSALNRQQSALAKHSDVTCVDTQISIPYIVALVRALEITSLVTGDGDKPSGQP